MNFTVTDTKTGEYPDLSDIALHEEWAQGLMYCDMDGFAILEDGTLILMDECGRFTYCPEGRFQIVPDEPNEPLPEEQLKKMIGSPIWIESAGRAEWMLLWGYNAPEVYGRAFIFTRRTGQKESFPFSDLGVTWRAYRRPPEGEA